MIAARRLLALLTRLENVFCLSGFTVLVLVLFVDVGMRWLFGGGIPWSHQVGIYANAALALVAMGLASSGGTHLRPRFADNWLPQKYHPQLETLGELISATVFFVFAVFALQMVLETHALGERSTVTLTLVWPIQLLLPSVFFVAALRHLLFAVFPVLRPTKNEQEA
ncbi:MAG: TRAP transporter small permease subunit [Pseudomonadales bacterium]